MRLLTGADFWSLHPEPAVGLRRLVVSDGPAGVRGERWDERETSANVPSPTALAATWDERSSGARALLAFEARRKGVDVLLAPTVNLHRTPYGGRHFECFSEDPLLTARIGVAYVRGVQDGGVGATVKHFVANDSETQRMTLDARVDERALRELYLAPFEAIVPEGGVWSVMAAYNGVNGHPMTESPLLRDILHGEWGFDGLVMSDWFAARSTEASAGAALDLVMPGPGGPWGDALIAAVREGQGRRGRRRRQGRAAPAPRGTRRGAGRVGRRPRPSLRRAGIAAALRRVAAAGFVLLRNEAAALPLDRSAVGRVAVLGPNAAAARTWAAAARRSTRRTRCPRWTGLRAALGEDRRGRPRGRREPSSRIRVAGAPWLRRPDGGGPGSRSASWPRTAPSCGPSIAPGVRSTGWARSATASRSATSRGSRCTRSCGPATPAPTRSPARASGATELSVGGELVFDGRLELPPGADIVEGLMIPPQAVHSVELDRARRPR